MPLVKTIKEFVSFILKGVDLIDHTSIFPLRTTNHYVILIICSLQCGGYSDGKNFEEVLLGTNHECVHIIRVT